MCSTVYLSSESCLQPCIFILYPWFQAICPLFSFFPHTYTNSYPKASLVHYKAKPLGMIIAPHPQPHPTHTHPFSVALDNTLDLLFSMHVYNFPFCHVLRTMSSLRFHPHLHIYRSACHGFMDADER